jgi:hypothetical protein
VLFEAAHNVFSQANNRNKPMQACRCECRPKCRPLVNDWCDASSQQSRLLHISHEIVRWPLRLLCIPVGANPSKFSVRGVQMTGMGSLSFRALHS